jgi:hypothetical protein
VNGGFLEVFVGGFGGVGSFEGVGGVLVGWRWHFILIPVVGLCTVDKASVDGLAWRSGWCPHGCP